MVELNMEHVLILVIAVFLLYHLMNRCSCSNGFSVGGEKSQNCLKTLRKICQPSPGENTCDNCAGNKQKQLKEAGCNDEDILRYCANTLCWNCNHSNGSCNSHLPPCNQDEKLTEAECNEECEKKTLYVCFSCC